MTDFHKIVVKQGSGKHLEVKNPTDYPLIGQGIQGAVFRLSPDRCVKIYPEKKHWMKEKHALETSQHLEFIPKIYEARPNYIIMEFIEGINLKQYLKRHIKKDPNLPQAISQEIVAILKQMEQSGFSKVDAPLRHILVPEGQPFKVVDHVYSMTDKQQHPERLLQNLDELGLLDQFLSHVKTIDNDLHSEWKKQWKKTSKKAK